jgi:hypothetical protein
MLPHHHERSLGLILDDLDSEEDEMRTYSNKIGGRGGEELDATIMQSNIEEEPKPNLDKVINNIQVEPMCLLNLYFPLQNL